MRQILIDKNKVTKKLLNAIMQNQKDIYDVFVKLSLHTTAPQIEHLKQSFKINDIDGYHFSITVTLSTISRLLSFDCVQSVGMLGLAPITDSKAVEPDVWPKLLPAPKEAPEASQAD